MSTTSSTSTRARRSTAVAVAAAVLGWVALLVLTAGRIRDELTATLHRDEAIAWTYASLPLEEIPGALNLDVNPPVYFMALHTWLAGGGEDGAFLRALSVLAVLAASAVSFDAARRLGGSRAGWLASAFVLLAPGSLALAGLARPYAIAFLLGMVALDAAIAMVRGAGWLSLATLSLTGALLPLTHYWGGLLLVSLLAGLGVTALVTGRRSILTRTLIATGISVVALMPWAPTLARQLGNSPLAAHQVPDAQLLGRTLTLSAGGRNAAWVVGIGFAVTIAAAWWRRRSGQPRPEHVDAGRLLLIATTLAATTAVVLVWGVSQVRPLFSPNYAFIVMAPLPVLVGVYLSRRWWTIAAVLASLAFVAVPDFSRSAFPTGPWDRDVRGPEFAIARSLTSWTDPGDVVVTSPGRVLAIRYYLGDDRDYVTPIGRVYDGTFDFRDRVARLQEADVEAVAGRLVDRPPGTRIAFVHDAGEPFDHEYWIELDRAMDQLGDTLQGSSQVRPLSVVRLPGPSGGILVQVFETQ